MLRLIAFPASEGDCLLLEYGDAAAPHRILIDGGRKATYRDHLRGWLMKLPPERRSVDLFVVTHVDRDHIEGALELSRDDDLHLRVDEIWFNAWPQLSPEPVIAQCEVLGVPDGERLSTRICGRKWPWNTRFGGKAVRRGVLFDDLATLPSGASLRLLSPDAKRLEISAEQWRIACRAAGLVPGAMTAEPPLRRRRGVLSGKADLVALSEEVTETDSAWANGSSIAFLFEYDGRRILFGADAHPNVLLEAVEQLSPGQPLDIHLLKVPHHGSAANVTKTLCTALRCRDALISTNGAMFNHPDRPALARILLSHSDAPRLHFNYASNSTLIWEAHNWTTLEAYEPTFPTKSNGLCILNFTDHGIKRDDYAPATFAASD